MKKEIRNITSAPELRKSDSGEESRRIEGYALVFGERSVDLGGFTEIISSGALDGVLERSDILALLNHNTERGVLARYRNGGGSLELTIDEKGLRYSFDAPNTMLGDEVLEGVRRGDISGSSFAFSVDEDEWGESEDGEIVRTIKRFSRLYDVSPVYHPAYEQTSVDTRGLDEYKAKKEAESRQEPDLEPEQEPAGDTEPEQEQEQESAQDPEPPAADPEPETHNNDNNITIITHRKMAKEKFSLIKTIRNAVEGRQQEDASAFAIEEGRRAAAETGLPCSGHIQLLYEPSRERRFEDNPNGILASQNPEAATYGGEDVPEDLFDLLGPLEERLVVTQLGARMLNLRGNVAIPFYSGTTSEWESEIGEAKEKAGKFRLLKMSPKRIATALPISKQFLYQADARSEALIRDNMINSIHQKLQSTLLGDGAGDDVTPAGLFNGISEEGAAFRYSDPIDWEEELETGRIYGEKKYIVSPKAKAIMRKTKLDQGSGRFVLENNEIYGIPMVSTGSCVDKGVILGDWSELYIASFGALDITVDTVTRAKNAQVLLVVNSWWDYLTVRPEAFVKKIIK